jgi:hypothetical protein
VTKRDRERGEGTASDTKMQVSFFPLGLFTQKQTNRDNRNDCVVWSFVVYDCDYATARHANYQSVLKSGGCKLT